MTFAITILLLVFLLSFRLLLLASSNDQNLLDVCSYAPEAEGSEFQDAEARVKANLSKVPAAPWKGLGEYRDYILQVDAMPVPGICCALFERAYYSTPWSRPILNRTGPWSPRSSATGHAGNDCPKDSKTRSQSVYRLEGPEVATSSHVMTNEFQGKEMLVYGHVRSESHQWERYYIPTCLRWSSKRKSIFQTTTRWLQWNGNTAWDLTSNFWWKDVSWLCL